MRKTILFIGALLIILGAATLSKETNGYGALLFFKKPYTCEDCNIILIVLDTLRADRLPCYGYEKNTAEHLCKFADQSFLFENHFVTAPRSYPSHASLFTSLLPSQHGMLTIKKDRLPDQITTLAEIVQANGYRTYWSAETDNPHISIERGFGRGFEDFEDEDYNLPFDAWEKSIERASETEQKIFMYLHTYKLHDPYTPYYRDSINLFVKDPDHKLALTKEEFENEFTKQLAKEADQIEPLIDDQARKQNRQIFQNPEESSQELRDLFDDYRGKNVESEVGDKLDIIAERVLEKVRWEEFDIKDESKLQTVSSLYDALLYELDGEMKKLFRSLEEKGLLEKSIVIVFSDHGEAFNEHENGLGHGQGLNAELVRTPLIIHIPGNQPKRITTNITSLDVLPTILDAVGIEIPTQAEGMSLLPLLRGDESSYAGRSIISEMPAIKHYESIIQGEWRLILQFDDEAEELVPKELYNIHTDPKEQENKIIQREDVVRKLQEELKRHREQSKAFDLPGADFPDWIDEETRKKLIETGYF
jgi:arylsulfatase A-like enzyme